MVFVTDNYGDCRTGPSALNHHTSSSVNNGHTGLSLLGHGGTSSASPALQYSSLYTTSQHVPYHHSPHLHHQSGSNGGGGGTGVSSPPLNAYYDLMHHINHGSSHATSVPKVECPSPPPAEHHHNASNRSPVLMTSHSPGESDLGASPHIVTLGNGNNNNKVVVMGGSENMERPTVVSMSS